MPLALAAGSSSGNCHRSRVPLLAIAALMASAEIGAGYFEEAHPDTAGTVLFASMSPRDYMPVAGQSGYSGTISRISS